MENNPHKTTWETYTKSWSVADTSTRLQLFEQCLNPDPSRNPVRSTESKLDFINPVNLNPADPLNLDEAWPFNPIAIDAVARAPNERRRTPLRLGAALLAGFGTLLFAALPVSAQTKFVYLNLFSIGSVQGDPDAGVRNTPFSDLNRYDSFVMRRGYSFNYNGATQSLSGPTLWQQLKSPANNPDGITPRVIIYGWGAVSRQQVAAVYWNRAGMERVNALDAGDTPPNGTLDNTRPNGFGDFHLKTFLPNGTKVTASDGNFAFRIGESAYTTFFTEAFKNDLITRGAGIGADAVHTDITRPSYGSMGFSATPANVGYRNQAEWYSNLIKFYKEAATKLSAPGIGLQIQATSSLRSLTEGPGERQMWIDLNGAPAGQRPLQLLHEHMFVNEQSPPAGTQAYVFDSASRPNWTDQMNVLAGIDNVEVVSSNNREFYDPINSMPDDFGGTVNQEQALTYALTSFLLVKRDSPRWFFGFNRDVTDDIHTATPWVPEFDSLNGMGDAGHMNLGAAVDGPGIGNFWTDPATGRKVFFRRFANGVAIVNPNDVNISGIPLTALFHPSGMKVLNRTNIGNHAAGQTPIPFANISNSTTLALNRARGAILRYPSSTPAAPTNLVATAASSSKINLTWTDNANNETGFEVDRARNSTFTSGLAVNAYTTGANPTMPVAATGLAAGTTYYFHTRATNTNGDSANSNTANATTQAAGGTTYSEDFNDGLAQNWALVSGTGNWSVASGKYQQSPTAVTGISAYSGATWNTGFTYHAKISPWGGSSGNQWGLVYNYVDASNYGELLLSRSGTATLRQFVNGTPTTVNGTWTYTNVEFPVQVIRSGTTTTVKVNGVTIFAVSQPALQTGKIGVKSQNSQPKFDDILVQ